ncbi:MAG: type I glyceraldehyde-3-phosphate dehydrogenase [Chloroflexota bacterium]
MTTKIAINGLGRIGRLVLRQILAAQEDGNDLNVVAVNDIAPADNLLYLLRHDSAYGEPPFSAEHADGRLKVAGKDIAYLSERDPARLPWQDLGVDIVIEATGFFTRRDESAKHLEAGAKHVIITAPGKNADITVCMGCNEDKLDPAAHRVVSNASCTTNCLATVAKVLDDAFGIEDGFLTTVHAYTSSQSLVDAPSKKWRRGRAAAISIVPTTTGAAISTTLVLPQLEGKIDGLAIRVPVVTGSVSDFVAHTVRPVSVEGVNEAFRTAAATERLKGILGVSDEELVSADIVGSRYSALLDAPSTMVLGDRTVKVLAWYDNEWGYSQRVVDITAYLGKRLETTHV